MIRTRVNADAHAKARKVGGYWVHGPGEMVECFVFAHHVFVFAHPHVSCQQPENAMNNKPTTNMYLNHLS